MNPHVMVLGWLILFLLTYIMGRIGRNLVEMEQKQYETEFLSQNRELIEQYQAKTLSFIPLRNEHRDPENLSSLCLQYSKLRIIKPFNYINEYFVRQFGPRVEVQLIRFRRVDEGLRPSESLPVELIKCTEDFAITTAGMGNYGYYVVRDLSDRNNLNADEIFFITSKFEYKEEVPLTDTQSVEQTQILERNRSTGELLRRRRRVTPDENADVLDNNSII